MLPVAEIKQAVETAASAWCRRGVPFQREDLVQEGWQIAMASLPAAQRTGDPIVPYLTRACIIALGNSIAAWSSAVSVSKHSRAMPSATAPSNLRCPIDFNDRCTGASPEDQTIDFDSLVRVRAEIERLIGELHGKDACIMRHVLKTGHDPKETKQALRVKLPQVWRAKRIFVRKARNDRRLREIAG